MNAFHLITKTRKTALAAALLAIFAVPAAAQDDIADAAQDVLQTDGDIVGGEVVVPETAADTSAINSIEKDGKRHTTLNLSEYAKAVNEAQWSPNMKVNTAMTVKLQALLDWNHASPGPIDGGWGMNSKKALINFQSTHQFPAHSWA
ncbi:peptidoglycan-binding domain-containing protein [Moraxella caviae]|nr:hypothetical protein [Moraxella caviae]